MAALAQGNPLDRVERAPSCNADLQLTQQARRDAGFSWETNQLPQVLASVSGGTQLSVCGAAVLSALLH